MKTLWVIEHLSECAYKGRASGDPQDAYWSERAAAISVRVYCGNLKCQVVPYVPAKPARREKKAKKPCP